MVSHPELGSDPPVRIRQSGRTGNRGVIDVVPSNYNSGLLLANDEAGVLGVCV